MTRTTLDARTAAPPLRVNCGTDSWNLPELSGADQPIGQLLYSAPPVRNPKSRRMHVLACRNVLPLAKQTVTHLCEQRGWRVSAAEERRNRWPGKSSTRRYTLFRVERLFAAVNPR
jgi:hypothetical protein